MWVLGNDTPVTQTLAAVLRLLTALKAVMGSIAAAVAL
jgi:hypothetical protein